MKAALLFDEGATESAATDEQKKLMRENPLGRVPKYIYPKGTIFDGAHAVFLVQAGMAEPLDDDCRKACGRSPEQVSATQTNYLMDLIGIRKLEDRDLFRGGIILGYDSDGKYLPGQNWDAYQAKIKEEEKADDI